jgi:peptide-methionine (S)-S-oxide reductase
MVFSTLKTIMPTPEHALKGRAQAITPRNVHAVHGRCLLPPFPSDCKTALFGLGCFWGAERKFWNEAGVFTTAVGYAGGMTPNPTYDEVCTGLTGHNEVVLVAYQPSQIALTSLLKIFFESHNPTQGMRQGNDVGTQYRSGIYLMDLIERELAQEFNQRYSRALQEAGLPPTTTEILPMPVFYYAEDYHQQYLAKNPNGYCGLGGTGISCDYRPSQS